VVAGTVVDMIGMSGVAPVPAQHGAFLTAVGDLFTILADVAKG